MSTSTFVAMERASAIWAIHAQIVQAVVASDEWEGAMPFDVAEVLGMAPRDTARHPILLLGGGANRAPLRALGAISLKQLDVTRVWAVPELVRGPSQMHTIAAVALVDGELPLIVLDPVTLLALAEEHRKS